jgi:ATP-dependent DNA helicase RecG
MSRILLDQNAPRQGFRIASPSYPTIALQELVRNAVIHRNYEATASPVMLTWYANRVEITSPGGLTARLPPKRSASPVLRMHAIQRLPAPRRRWASCNDLGRESPPAMAALRANGNRPAEFRTESNFVNVTVWAVA